MKALKRELEAVAAILEAGAEDSMTLAAMAIAEIDQQRGGRSFQYGVLLVAGIGKVIGPFATPLQALRATAKHGAERAWVVGGHTSEGLDLHMVKVDEPAPTKGDFAVVHEDSLAFKKGWDGKQSTKGSWG